MGEFTYGFGLNHSTGRTGVGYNVGGWQVHTVQEVVPRPKDDKLRSREDAYKRSKKRDDDDSSPSKTADDVSSVAAKAKAAQEEAVRKKAEAKERAAQEKEEAREQAAQEKADKAYLERFEKGKPLLTAAGLSWLAEYLSNPRFIRSTGTFRGKETVARCIGGYLREGWTIAGVEEQQRSRPGKGKLGGLFNESYTMQVVKLTSPSGKTVTVDAAEKRK
jgi:hypothetical protein